MRIKSFIGYLCLDMLYRSDVSVICNNGLYYCFIYFRDGYVVRCYTVSVIVMLLMVPFPLAACSHFCCFVQWFCQGER
jgi:hypothetical protein